MPAAARVTDNHKCPLAEPGPVRHEGGPISHGDSTVLIANQPAARLGDVAVCIGPPDSVKGGSPTVLIGNKQAARMGDPTMHGGVIVAGCPTVKIGDSGGGASVKGGGAPLVEPCAPQGGRVEPDPTM